MGVIPMTGTIWGECVSSDELGKLGEVPSFSLIRRKLYGYKMERCLFDTAEAQLAKFPILSQGILHFLVDLTGWVIPQHLEQRGMFPVIDATIGVARQVHRPMMGLLAITR